MTETVYLALIAALTTLGTEALKTAVALVAAYCAFRLGLVQSRLNARVALDKREDEPQP